MINRLFSFVSQRSGVALSAMVVGAVALHAHNGGADAGIGAQTVAADGQGVSMRDALPSATKTETILGMFIGTGRPPGMFIGTGRPPSMFIGTGRPPV